MAIATKKVTDYRKIGGELVEVHPKTVGSQVLLTGYSKPGSTSAVAATDTVNAALGKLEKGFDGVVHTTGNETIAGTKTFSSVIEGTARKAYNDGNGTLISPTYNGFRSNIGDPTLFESGVIPEEFSNKTEFMPQDYVLYEISDDGGATWQTLTVDAGVHKALWGGTQGSSISFYKIVGTTSANYKTLSAVGTVNLRRFRFTISPRGYVYLNMFYMYSTGTGSNFRVLLEKYYGANDTWSTVSDNNNVTIGWPAHNVIKHGSIPFASSSDKYNKVRVTIYPLTVGATVTENGVTYARDPSWSIYKIRYYGGYPYENPFIYTVDGDKNTTFPANVTAATKISSPIIETGTAATNYFQSRKFRGEGDANTYYHAVDFGYSGHNQVDFYEYGGIYVFHKHTGAGISAGDTILGTINDYGWEGNVKGNVTGNADTATAVKTEQATTDASRRVPFSHIDSTNAQVKLVYNDSFKYNPATNTLTVGKITGEAGSVAWANVTGKPDLSVYATDSNVVHKTGNESISGVKEFDDYTRAKALVSHSTVSDPLVYYPYVSNGFMRKNGAQTGAIKITLPKKDNGTFLSFIAYVQDDSAGVFEYHIKGYMPSSGTGWLYCDAYCTGTDNDKGNLSVRFGYDSTNALITIGETNTTWTSVLCAIYNVTTSYQNYSADNWATGWSLAMTTTLPTTVKVTKSNVNIVRKVNNTTAGPLGWTDKNSAHDTSLATINTLAYWDGRYWASGASTSNLEYVKLGKLGSIVTHDASELSGKQELLSCGEKVGSMYRSNVAGTGGFSINSTTGEFPTVTQAGTYIIITKMSSLTASYTCQFSLGSNTFSISTTDGKINDHRVLTVAANSSWSGAVTAGSLATGTILDVRLYYVGTNVSELGIASVTNSYNDLYDVPDIVTYGTSEFIRGTQTAATGSFTGATKDAALYDGKRILYWLPYAGSGNATLNLTLASGSTTGAIPVYYGGTTRLTTHYGVNNVIPMTYNATNNAWYCDANYYTYAQGQYLFSYNNTYFRSAVAAESLAVGDSTGYVQAASGVSFDISYPILWVTAAVAAGGTNYANTFIMHYDRSLANVKSTFSGTAKSMVYLVVTLSGTTATIDSTVITCSLPSIEDGKLYISLGRLGTQSTGQNFFILYPTHPIFYYKAGAIHEYAYVPVDASLSSTSANPVQNKAVYAALEGKSPTGHSHAAGDVTSGTFDAARIPNLAASKITSGTFDAARIPSLDASKITSGTISIDRLPAGALERLVTVANQAARFALTTSSVQLGDTVKQLDTGIMYIVTDTANLGNANGYTEYTAGTASAVPWSGITGKPSTFTPETHTHTRSQITDLPGIVNNTSVGTLGYSAATSAHDLSLTTVNTIAFWNGAYTGTASNLAYCNKGAFGTAVTHADSDYVHMTGNETIAGNKTFSNDITAKTKINLNVTTSYIQYNATTGCVEIIC